MMQANPHLSIVIPTYNRADLLDYCLAVHIPLARAHNVQLFISDNASTDATGEVVKKRIKEYPFIQYHRNATNVTPDENFEIALKYPKTHFVWLLGDSYQIPSNGIEYLLNLILDGEEKYDLFVLNLFDKVKNVPAQNFSDSNSLLCSLGALMTCLSCLVYSRNLIDMADFHRYRNSCFIQTGIIFETIARQPFNVHWAKSISVKGLEHRTLKKYSWIFTSNVFEIACTKWVNFVFSLPVAYGLNSKIKCLIDFTKVSGVFSFRHLLTIRSSNVLNYKTYRQYSHLFPLTIKYSRITMLMIALFPRGILRALKAVHKMSKDRQ